MDLSSPQVQRAATTLMNGPAGYDFWVCWRALPHLHVGGAPHGSDGILQHWLDQALGHCAWRGITVLLQ